MLELLAQAVIWAALVSWVWFLPNAMVGRPLLVPPPWLRRAVARVKYFLTWPGRSQAARDAAQTALIAEWNRKHPRSRELMIGTAMKITALHPEDEILVRRDGRGVQVVRTAGLPAGFVPPAGSTSWAPNLIAAMPTGRCNTCPLYGCAEQGKRHELPNGEVLVCEIGHRYRPGCGCGQCSDVVSYEEVTTHEQNKPVAYVPRIDRCGSCAANAAAGCEYCIDCDRAFNAVPRAVAEALRDQSGRDRLAALLGIARLPRPGDDEIAKPPRDVFDAHTPPKHVRPPEERLAASLPCPFCGGQPIMVREVSEAGELRTVWQEVHGKRCVLRKRPPRRRRPSGAQRRKLRDRVKGSIEAAVAEQLAEDARQLGAQGRAELGRLAASLRRKPDKGVDDADRAMECGCYDAARHRDAAEMWPYLPAKADRVRR